MKKKLLVICTAILMASGAEAINAFAENEDSYLYSNSENIFNAEEEGNTLPLMTNDAQEETSVENTITEETTEVSSTRKVKERDALLENSEKESSSESPGLIDIILSFICGLAVGGVLSLVYTSINNKKGINSNTISDKIADTSSKSLELNTKIHNFSSMSNADDSLNNISSGISQETAGIDELKKSLAALERKIDAFNTPVQKAAGIVASNDVTKVSEMFNKVYSLREYGNQKDFLDYNTASGGLEYTNKSKKEASYVIEKLGNVVKVYPNHISPFNSASVDNQVFNINVNGNVRGNDDFVPAIIENSKIIKGKIG